MSTVAGITEPAAHRHRTFGVIAVAGAALVSLIAALAITQLTRDAPTITSRAAQPGSSSNAQTAPNTVNPFSLVSPGSQVAPTDWVEKVRALTTTQGHVSGVINARNTNGLGTPLEWTFDVDPGFGYRIRTPLALLVGFSDGTQVTVDDVRREVLILDSPPADIVTESRELAGGLPLLPDDTLNRALFPDWWLETTSRSSEITITYLGTEPVGGAPAARFNVAFATISKYAPAGWDIYVDLATGVLVHSVLRSPDGGGEELTVSRLTADAERIAAQAVTVPAGYTARGAINLSAGGIREVQFVLEQPTEVSAILSRAREAASTRER